MEDESAEKLVGTSGFANFPRSARVNSEDCLATKTISVKMLLRSQPLPHSFTNLYCGIA